MDIFLCNSPDGRNNNSANADKLRESLGVNDREYRSLVQVHHIVMTGGTDAPSVEARQLLNDLQIDINDSINGIPLARPGVEMNIPRDMRDEFQLSPEEPPLSLRAHRGTDLHSDTGRIAIRNRLNDAVKRALGIDDLTGISIGSLSDSDWANVREEVLEELGFVKRDIIMTDFP